MSQGAFIIRPDCGTNMAMRDRRRRERPPLDEEAIEQAALGYAGRYATTRARLAAYLRRKLAERGWGGGGEPPVERLVEPDRADGILDQLFLRGVADESVAAAKIIMPVVCERATSPSAAISSAIPVYIGFRTHRYGPRTTRRRGGSNGAGVPAPVHAKLNIAGSTKASPAMTTATPATLHRGSSDIPRPAAIHRGMNHSQIEPKIVPKTVVRRRAKSCLAM